MIFTLKHFNTPLIAFSADAGAEMNIEVTFVNEGKRSLFPLDLQEVSPEGIQSWLKHRTVPKNRAYVDSILSSMGLSINRPLDVIRVSKGLSLNDCFWVCPEGDDSAFDAVNLYDNRFSRVLGQIAFTGYGSSNRSLITSSPEFTTNGTLPKCWRRESGIIKLYKGGTEGASNTGNEPYSEFYAYQIAKELGVNAVQYDLARWKGRLCSVCALFTSKEKSFVPVGRIVTRGGLQAVKTFYESLGPEFVQAFGEMIVLDAVLFNADRHYGNFGFLVDSESNQIIAPAPLFDHGNSLFNYAGRDNLTDEKALLKYASTVLPCVYDQFVGEAKAVMTKEMRSRLRRLLAFEFVKHSRYNLPEKRLSLIETVVRGRVRELLDL
ncbi:MAG: XRE family transcriptional regulator [Clostridia bacterium]|nr:XRE family transcriptional regulator [Clostridia bacterium]